jgi:hypothetical protein
VDPAAVSSAAVPDEPESLDDLLAQLKGELADWDSGDQDPDELHRIVAAVERRLDPDDDTEDDGILDEVTETAVRFESSHPGIAGALRNLAANLGGFGL